MTSRPSSAGTRTRARAPRNTLNRERVLTAAAELLDSAGPDAFTMRALAERLDVATMAVYSHFSGKNEIIDAVRQRLLAEAELPFSGAVNDGVVPREELRELCRAVYRLLAGHPSVLRLLADRPVEGDECTLFAERALDVLLRAGLERGEAARAYTSLLQFTVGAALWAARGRGEQVRTGTGRDERLRARIARLSADRYPRLVGLAPELENATGGGMEQYECGLDALLAGLLGTAGPVRR